MFNEKNEEAALMVDASNALNAINRETFLYSTKILSLSISTYINNCYSSPKDIFIKDPCSIKSEKEKTQGDPTAMAIYTPRITPLLAWLRPKKILLFTEKKTSPERPQFFCFNQFNCFFLK